MERSGARYYDLFGYRRQCSGDTGGGSAVLAGHAYGQLTANHWRRESIGWCESHQIGPSAQAQVQIDVYVRGNSAGQDLSRGSNTPCCGDVGMVIVHTECPTGRLLRGGETRKLTRKPE